MIILKNACIHTGTGTVIEEGTVIIEDGKILKVGQGIEEPSGAEVRDLKGRVVTPGLIDAHTHVGIGELGMGWEGQDYNEIVDPVTPHLRALDGINPHDGAFRDAREHGVTSIMCAPGSANIIGGEALIIRTWGETVEEMLVLQPAGIKAALGENPKRVYGKDRKPAISPVTRMASAALIRETLVNTATYLKKKEKEGEDYLERDLKLESMARVLLGEIPLKIHAHRSDDIMTAIRIGQEFSIPVTLEHCSEGHKLAQHIKNSGYPAIIGPTLCSSQKIETRDKTWDTPRILHEAGVLFAIMTDHPVIPVEYLSLCAALAVKAGLPREEGLKAVTLNAAGILGVDHRLGSLAEGKDADLVVWDEHPFILNARAQEVYIQGRQVL